MKSKLVFNFLLSLPFFILFTQISLAQSDNNINPSLDKYYDTYPSGIRNSYQSTDFINVVDLVHFIPNKKELNGSQQLFKRVILMLDQEDLNQMRMTGDYYSRTFKHYDYMKLYNMIYNPINKETWDRLCPYLLPLMDIDGTLNLK